MYPVPFNSEHPWVIYGLRLDNSFEYRYVGLTRIGALNRLKRHFYDSNKRNTHVYQWIRRFKKNIIVDVLEECAIGDDDYLCQAEEYWISQIRSFGHSLTNHSLGGESGSYGARWTLTPDQVRAGTQHPMFGLHHSEESKLKMSNAKTGTKRSEESKRKQSEAIRGENHWTNGRGFSKEHKKNISKSLSGRKLSDEHRKKMSESRKGIAPSEKARLAHVKGESHPFYGKPAHNKGKPSTSAHTRWHTNKGVTSSKCRYCIGE